MKRLVIVRHSKAEEHRPGLSDFNRKLAKRGRKEAPLIAEKLKALNIEPDLIISSPAARAYQSSLQHAGILNYPKEKILLFDFIYDYFDVDDLRQLLVESAKTAQIVFIFGHNPTLADLAYELTGSFNKALPTSGAIGLEFEMDNWADLSKKSGSIIFFEYPKKYLKADK
ncbi:MAG: histidine phosphatase family protein [Bacteroidetes bacterium]|nr:histidine phosphatase family protein [Bacteroidota bacterium]